MAELSADPAAAIALLALVTAQRAGELAYAHHNEGRLKARGAWTTRIVVLPRTPLISDGPYRFMRHPNYAIVMAEIYVLPMVFGLYAYAVALALLNAVLLAVRIRAENQALQSAAPSPE